MSLRSRQKFVDAMCVHNEVLLVWFTFYLDENIRIVVLLNSFYMQLYVDDNLCMRRS